MRGAVWWQTNSCGPAVMGFWSKAFRLPLIKLGVAGNIGAGKLAVRRHRTRREAGGLFYALRFIQVQSHSHSGRAYMVPVYWQGILYNQVRKVEDATVMWLPPAQFREFHSSSIN